MEGWVLRHYLYANDGNGNVAGLVNATNGILAAQYEYDPFGNVLRSTGASSLTNVMRFSSKMQDLESGWNYYGYRYYNPGIGRWVSRDPIGEKGGANLHGFNRGNPIHYVDILGLDSYGVFNVVQTTATLGSDADKHNAKPGDKVPAYEVWYRPTPTKTSFCPCKKENIVLVQAIKSNGPLGLPPHIDASAEAAANNTQAALLPPAYTDSFRQGTHGPLSLIDTPYSRDARDTRYEAEVCGICRVPGRKDVVLGCVKLTWKDESGKLGEPGLFEASAPGDLWKDALKNWLSEQPKK